MEKALEGNVCNAAPGKDGDNEVYKPARCPLQGKMSDFFFKKNLPTDL